MVLVSIERKILHTVHILKILHYANILSILWHQQFIASYSRVKQAESSIKCCLLSSTVDVHAKRFLENNNVLMIFH